jgi:hypothetical protein
VRTSTFRLNALYNTRLSCSFTGCKNRRKAVGRYCAAHARTSACFGHPLGHLITKKQYASHVKMACRLLKRLDGHPALPVAFDVMRRLLTQGEEPTKPRPLRTNPKWLLWRELDRLHDVTPQEALAVVVGAWLFAFFNSRQLPSDARLTYQLGQSVLRLRQLAVVRSYYDHSTGKVDNTHRTPPGLAVGLLGKRIREQLAPFLGNITQLVEQEHQQSAARAMALRQPLTTPA